MKRVFGVAVLTCFALWAIAPAHSHAQGPPGLGQRGMGMGQQGRQFGMGMAQQGMGMGQQGRQFGMGMAQQGRGRGGR